jgi:hypothetical protein
LVPDRIVEFIESGVSILIGTRDAALRPSTSRGYGIVVAPDRRVLTVFFPQRTGERVQKDLAEGGNKRIAIGISRPFDHFAVQLKGTCTEIRPATDAERPLVEGYLAAFVEQLYLAGIPRSLAKRAHVWPAWAATFTVEDVFLQTPGPEAGRRYEDAAS